VKKRKTSASAGNWYSILWFPACNPVTLLKDSAQNLTFMEPCISNVFLSTTNGMQRYTVFFIVVSALHVSNGFSAHHQELKNCTCSIGTCQTCVLLPLAWWGRNSRYTMFFIVVNAVNISSGFSAHHQELKNCTCSIGTCQTCVLLPLAWLSRNCVEHWQQ
jgi:hypothetical protein